MNKYLYYIMERFFIRNPWKRAHFYKKCGMLHNIGENCYIATRIPFQEADLISIGNNVWITSGVHLINHDASVQVVQKVRNYHGIDKVGIIDIGNNVFIGNNTIIMPGVKIGNNCIIGAGSVVTKSIPDNSVVAGNPAKAICNFEEYADRCIEHSNKYPWLWLSKPKEIRECRKTYFWEEGHLK